ncbi:MAG: hypothetical protein FRX48_03686 [Lasallia pustulata]|uniref:Asteroid domain-containing protein n=1 Tax=Lasallia pustulata TaxID=136370 RepID=A0A5M8PTE5_9LECA|nr:MAG: hypothetical protein FRX48_03686 [Lasallia pustulata]
MGIQGLTVKLQPYATPATLGSYNSYNANDSQDTSRVIIDGPSLAYYVYYRLLASKPASLNAFDSAPSYKELGQGALVFLDTLSEHNVTIDSIFFDGFLPPQKQAVRTSRLEGSLKQLLIFQSTHPNGLRVLPEPSKPLVIEAAHVLDSSRPVPTPFKGLPAAPFLVPAVIEALASSYSYASTVQIVPAEADPYCAAAARQDGGVILTNDSDMLVHDIGPNGAVAFFNQLEFRESAAEYTSIHVLVCRPVEIAKRLGLDDLQRLAFEVKKDPAAMFHVALGKAKMYKPTGIRDAHYDEFLEEYSAMAPGNGRSQILMPATLPIDPSELQLDPRVSELVLQFAASAEPQVKMYLPFLIDDPTRSSAWGVSSSLRRLAYSLLSFLTTGASKVQSVVDYGRKGLRMASQEVRLLTKQQCLLYVQGLKESFSQLRSASGLTTSHHLFKAYAIYMVCQWYVNNDKPRPARDALVGLLTGTTGKTLTWVEIHLSAQLQAALYSLRMLKHLLRYVELAVGRDIPPLLKDLDMSLEDLEPIERLIPSRLEVVMQEQSKSETPGLLDVVFSLLGDESTGEHKVDAGNTEENSATEPIPAGFTEISGRMRKKGRIAPSKPIAPVSKEPSKKLNNIYRLLADS